MARRGLGPGSPGPACRPRAAEGQHPVLGVGASEVLPGSWDASGTRPSLPRGAEGRRQRLLPKPHLPLPSGRILSVPTAAGKASAPLPLLKGVRRVPRQVGHAAWPPLLGRAPSGAAGLLAPLGSSAVRAVRRERLSRRIVRHAALWPPLQI